MWPICKKEFRQFFSSLTGLIAIFVFSALNGLMLFIFSSFNILEAEYATLDNFFYLAPLILLSLIPAITMRSFSDEFKGGTYEILQTRPLSRWQIVTGKYFGSLIVVTIALIPTVIYMVSIQALSTNEAGIDIGSTIGSYLGLFFLAAVFTAIGVCCSSFTGNSVVAFITGALACLLFYIGFAAISQIPALNAGADYYLEMFGIAFHYESISRGVLDSRDVIYFLSIIIIFLFLTYGNLIRR